MPTLTPEPEVLEEPQQHGGERPPFLQRREGRILVLSIAALVAAGIGIFSYHYLRLARITDQRLATGPFADTVNVYSAPRSIAVGDRMTAEQLVSNLRQSGYSPSHSNKLGSYNVRTGAVEIFPGPNSYSSGEPGLVEFAGGKITRIVSLQDNTERRELQVEPQLIANLSEDREKRRLVHYPDIPKTLVHALISVEDKHFFSHGGFDLLRIFKAAYVDLKDGRKQQGASTLTMQLARGLWLDPDKNWKRKWQEFLITLHLEQKRTKEQIFEDYANQVYLGRRGTFSVNGFGEGARTYFDKDLSQLNHSEAALLAGLVQRPSYYNPYRYPERARNRRNVVLSLMRQNGYLSAADYQRALATPIQLAPEQSDSVESQYFFDLVNDEVQARLDDHDKQTRYVCTTLDPALQQAAQEAVRIGMQNVDRLLKPRKGREKLPEGQPQVALVALDPRTGEVKALAGGRSYGTSQFNHALALRQPGSVFKPFVYAAALDTAIRGDGPIFTPASVVDDSPTTFVFGKQIYEPGNFGGQFMGQVTLRTALSHSLNNAAVSLAEQVGYANVVAMARRAGLNDGIQPTPAVALGAYETTPLEIAGAYTIFANQGMRATPATVSLVRGVDGKVLYRQKPELKQVLDPRVAYLMVNMMEDVVNRGTAAGVRARGFTLPAAGKTGTSHDGWFAGFTSELITVVWVGFDDDRELNLEGSKSALPIWTEFMKRAAKLRQYRAAKAFEPPAGIVSATICEDSGDLASPSCSRVRSDYFVDGSQPVAECRYHSTNPQHYAERVMDPVDRAVPARNTIPEATPSPFRPRP